MRKPLSGLAGDSVRAKSRCLSVDVYVISDYYHSGKYVNTVYPVTYWDKVFTYKRLKGMQRVDAHCFPPNIYVCILYTCIFYTCLYVYTYVYMYVSILAVLLFLRVSLTEGIIKIHKKIVRNVPILIWFIKSSSRYFLQVTRTSESSGFLYHNSRLNSNKFSFCTWLPSKN